MGSAIIDKRANLAGFAITGRRGYSVCDDGCSQRWKQEDLAGLVRKSDFVSIHCVWWPLPRGRVGMSALKPGAFLIDVSWGGRVDAAALAQVSILMFLSGNL